MLAAWRGMTGVQAWLMKDTTAICKSKLHSWKLFQYSEQRLSMPGRSLHEVADLSIHEFGNRNL